MQDVAKEAEDIQIDLSHMDVRLFFHSLKVAPRHATFCAHNMAKVCRRHTIVTNRGRKKRIVYAPNRALKWIQIRIKDGLLARVPRDPCVHGFVSGRGCLSNAEVHVDSQVLVNIDLKDFFPSIGSDRVYGWFRSMFSMHKSLAATITSLTTYDRHLCQGFVTSPDIANLLTISGLVTKPWHRCLS